MAISVNDNKAVLQQAIQVWSMLDEMSENNPETYRDFIECHSPPQPYSCIHTALQGETERTIYLNICGWKRVPAPKSDIDPVPVLGGRMEMVTNKKEQYIVVEVAFNPEVLQKMDRSKFKRKEIHQLALNFIEKKHNLKLSPHYKLAKEKFKGSIQDMKQCMLKPETSKSSIDTAQSEAATSLLQQISSLRIAETDEDSSIKLSIEQESPVRPGLIEVISSIESQPQQPKHYLTTCPNAGGGSARSLNLLVELPGVRSVSQCELSISQDDVLLEVEDLYLLHLPFPELVKEETCTAVFSKKKQTLKLTVNVL